jgi:hypothetical protein
MIGVLDLVELIKIVQSRLKSSNKLKQTKPTLVTTVKEQHRLSISPSHWT